MRDIRVAGHAIKCMYNITQLLDTHEEISDKIKLT